MATLSSAGPVASASFPREIARNIFWLGYCGVSKISGNSFHVHNGLYLLVGSKSTLLIDTGTPSGWPKIRDQLQRVLKGRHLDFVMPTHPEIPHSSALSLILNEYPNSRVVGDMTDYELYFPDYTERMDHRNAGDKLDLGGITFEFIDAVIKDLPNTMWGYAHQPKVMFVSDGFSYAHDVPGTEGQDEPLHLPGNCALTSSEIKGGVNVKQASFIVRAALHWTRFTDPSGLFKRLDDVMKRYPAEIVCPAHGNVIVDLETVYPIIREVHKRAFETAMSGSYSFGV